MFDMVLNGTKYSRMDQVQFSLDCRPEACNFIKKETLAHVFSCEFCEISKNIFSYRTTPVAASESKNIVARIMTYMLYICVFFEENFFFCTRC